MQRSPPLVLRPLNESDLPFILNSWLKSYRNSKLTKDWTNPQYYGSQKPTIETLLSEFPTVVACSEEDPHIIFGYACGYAERDRILLHYLYVKRVFRRMGIAKALIAYFGPGEIVTTHWMPICKKLGIKRLRLENAR